LYATHAPRPLLWRAFAINAAVLTVAAVVLAVSPATVSFPIAVAEALVLAGGLAATLACNLALLPRAAAAPCADDAPRVTAPPRRRVAQVLVCWTRPQRLSVDEAERWLRGDLARLLAAERVDGALLSRVGLASVRHGTPYAWLLELDVPSDCDAQTWLESPAWREWLGDLHALGLRPAAMLVDQERVLTREPH
jgi:hypothetical protein